MGTKKPARGGLGIQRPDMKSDPYKAKGELLSLSLHITGSRPVAGRQAGNETVPEQEFEKIDPDFVYEFDIERELLDWTGD